MLFATEIAFASSEGEGEWIGIYDSSDPDWEDEEQYYADDGEWDPNIPENNDGDWRYVELNDSYDADAEDGDTEYEEWVKKRKTRRLAISESEDE